MIGGLGYYIYRTKKGQATAGQGKASRDVPNDPPKSPHPPRSGVSEGPKTNIF